jgi:hypothetical protein
MMTLFAEDGSPKLMPVCAHARAEPACVSGVDADIPPLPSPPAESSLMDSATDFRRPVVPQALSTLTRS